MKKQSPTDFEVGISLVLQIGVTVSVATILLGVILLFVQQESTLHVVSYDTYLSTHAAFAHSLGSIARAVAAGDSLGIIEFGVLLLIMTPITRVAMSFVLFLHKRDTPMILVTAMVFLVLVGSFSLGVISR